MSDVRAAADWYSLDNARELLEEAQGHYPPAFWRDHLNAAFHKGRQIAEHPPDELLPPTPEWVTERLGERSCYCWFLSNLELREVKNELDGEISFDLFDGHGNIIETIHTRRQFLALCVGLGVEVKVEKHHG